MEYIYSNFEIFLPGEILFLAWGIKVCYNVRNAESLFNEARLISYAIYNIAAVNITMIAIHLFIFPHAGPDIKYLLGFLRTQLSTSVTVFLVFAPKVNYSLVVSLSSPRIDSF